MHISDKNAPKMGTLLYYVNELENSTEVSQYVVAYDGTQVCLVMLNNPSVKIKYEQLVQLATSAKEAYLQASKRCEIKAMSFMAMAERLKNKAEEIK